MERERERGGGEGDGDRIQSSRGRGKTQLRSDEVSEGEKGGMKTERALESTCQEAW